MARAFRSETVRLFGLVEEEEEEDDEPGREEEEEEVVLRVRRARLFWLVRFRKMPAGRKGAPPMCAMMLLSTGICWVLCRLDVSLC